jgi:hypothetical protein
MNLDDIINIINDGVQLYSLLNNNQRQYSSHNP